MKLKIPIAFFSLYSFHLSNTTLLQNYKHKKINYLKKKKKPKMLTYESRLLRAVRASSGEPIVTKAKPLFLTLLCIESLTTTPPKEKHTQTHIRKTNKKQNPQNKIAQNKLKKEKKKRIITSTSRTVPCFSKRVRTSSAVQDQGTFWAISLSRENSSVSGSNTWVSVETLGEEEDEGACA